MRASIAYRSVLARRAGIPPATSSREKIGPGQRPSADERVGDRSIQGGDLMVRVSRTAKMPSLASRISSSECGMTATTSQPYASSTRAATAPGSNVAGAC